MIPPFTGTAFLFSSKRWILQKVACHPSLVPSWRQRRIRRKIVSIILCLLLFTDFVVRIFVPKIGAAEGLGSSGTRRHGVGGSVAG